jgi:hypothetical protein
MTFSVMTLTIITLRIMKLSITKFSIMTLSITKFSIMTLSIMTLSIMTLSIMTFRIMTLSITTFIIMTLSIMTLIIMTLSIMTLSIMTLSILTLSIKTSSSRGKSPSALHSYSKRRFIKPFAPPCFLFTFSSVVVSWPEPGGQWEGESRGPRRKPSGESRPELAEGCWLVGWGRKIFNNSIV